MWSSIIRIHLVQGFLLCILVFSIGQSEASSESNSTDVSVSDEDDDSLPDITLEEFKERYRRLIPYMTFFVANNYANTDESLPQSTSAKDVPQSSPLIRLPPPQYVRPNSPGPQRGNNYRGNAEISENKFIPSVQFDPRNVGADNGYFTPVRYNSKVNYDEYSATPYHAYQDQEQIYSEITTDRNQGGHKENRYYANVRPLRPYTTNGRDHLPRKQTKHVQSNLRDDYVLDYNVRPNVGNYLVKEFSGNPYIPQIAYANILDPVPGKRNPLIPQPYRNPNVNLQQITENFQLNDHLPEILNNDNIDDSLKTLLDILNILQNKKKEEYLQTLTPITSVSSSARLPQKSSNYKTRLQNRPKVVTETRFQATPNPLYVTDDPDRYRVTAYEDDVQRNAQAQPSYNTNALTNSKVEYYVPVIQDIPTRNDEPFLPTIRPQADAKPVDHSYAITEDLSDDIAQDERFTLPPITTEHPVHNYKRPNEIPTSTETVPRTSLKYGATRGKARVDYPAYATIPQTKFNCKEQRYKGFFGDPDTGCQVWHYCDLNGGKSSFLCPNGTIFSQVALTCDWWFNVKCETTKQLYVLNERLYKYILPFMPKFPEDFTGPEVDRYLELKFKEMEARLKEKKRKQKEEKEKLKNKSQTPQKGKNQDT